MVNIMEDHVQAMMKGNMKVMNEDSLETHTESSEVNMPLIAQRETLQMEGRNSHQVSFLVSSILSTVQSTN